MCPKRFPSFPAISFRQLSPKLPGIFSLFLLLLLVQGSFATNISGIVNRYAGVSAIDYVANTVTVTSATHFSVNDKVLLIQMQGASIDETNSTNFGNVSAYNDAGKWEYLTISAISGTTLTMRYMIERTYTPSTGVVQLVKVPQYTDATVTADLIGKAFDGGNGGVIAIDVTNTLTLNANIDADGIGFRGATGLNLGSCDWWTSYTNYYYASGGYGAYKGEGIASFLSNKEGGRGKQANGGGGANNHDGGGAGGGNAGAGGQGGQNLRPGGFSFRCQCLWAGEGGAALTYSNVENRVYPGGGGGSGYYNNNVGSTGQRGGGIIIIRAGSIVGNSNLITADGNSNTSTAGADGSGGGGAGGTILLTATSYSAVTASVDGGAGGSTNNDNLDRCVGPGGGGGAGAVWFSNGSTPAGVTVSQTGGAAGTTLASAQGNCVIGGTNGAVAGAASTPTFSLSATEGATPLPIELLTFKAGQQGEMVALEWKTASELNNDRFEVQRSLDGELFETVAEVRGAGTTNRTSHYEAWDHQAVEGLSYYRIRQIDYDGKSSNSWLVAVEYIPPSEVLGLYPNPVANGQSVVLDLRLHQKEVVDIAVADASGRIVQQQSVELSKGFQKQSIATDDLSNGIYFVRVALGSTSVKTNRLVIAQ